MLFVCMWFEVKLFFLRCLVNRFLCMLFVSVCDNFMHNFTVILHLIQLDWQEHNVFVSLSPSLSLTQLIILSLCLQDVVVLLICLFVRLFSILFARERSCVLVYSINYIPIPMHGICAPNAEMFYPQFSFQCITHRQCKCMQLLETCTFVAQNIRNASLFIDFLFARRWLFLHFLLFVCLADAYANFPKKNGSRSMHPKNEAILYQAYWLRCNVMWWLCDSYNLLTCFNRQKHEDLWTKCWKNKRNM